MSELLKRYNYKADKYVPFVGTEDWVEVAALRHSERYEWADFNAFYSPSARRYFWYGDSGCSCNSWGESIDTSADFENGDRDDLLRAWKSFAKDKSYYLGPASRVDGSAKIRTFNPGTTEA